MESQVQRQQWWRISQEQPWGPALVATPKTGDPINAYAQRNLERHISEITAAGGNPDHEEWIIDLDASLAYSTRQLNRSPLLDLL